MVIRRLVQDVMQPSALFASTSFADSVRRGARLGVACASAVAFVSYGLLLPLVMVRAAVGLYQGDSFGEAAKRVGTAIAMLALFYPVMCAVFVVFGVAAVEYVRRFTRPSLTPADRLDQLSSQPSPAGSVGGMTDLFFVGSMVVMGLVALMLANWLWTGIFFAIAVVMRLITIVERRFGLRDYDKNPIRFPSWGFSTFIFFPLSIALLFNGETGFAIAALVAGGCLLGMSAAGER